MMNKRTEMQTRHYTYADCLRDVAPYPTGTNGTTLYQLLMVGGSVTIMVTANGLHSSGTDFLKYGH